ncbi:MAG: putative porin [Rikenellaceae bacterium]|nr:putative porin [Rikenellaceae bacterium]
MTNMFPQNHFWLLRALMTLVLTAFCGLAYAQFGTDDIYDRTGKNNNIPATGVKDPDAPVDSIGGKRQRRERRPFESYLFVDSVRMLNAFSWRHNPYNNNVTRMPIDTMLSGFYRDYAFFQNESVGNAYLGNLGGAVMPLDFFSRKRSAFSFLDAYAEYLYTPDNVLYYNARRPFSQLSFFMSGQSRRAEEQLRVLHSQNISPSTSINLTYRNNGTKGMYNNQRTTDKNLSLAFAHTGARYSVHGGYIYNMGNIRENGGLVDDREVTDTLIDLPQNLTMKMKDARNLFKGNIFYFTQSVGIPFVKPDRSLGETLADVPAVFVGSYLNYTKYRKTYTDNRAFMVDDVYENWYVNPHKTVDSMSERLLEARVFAQIQPYNRNGVFGTIDGGVGFKNERFYNFRMADYLSPSKGDMRNSMYVYANAGGRLSRYFVWSGRFHYTPMGYRNQDMTIGGNVEFSAYVRERKLSLSADVQYKMETPSYWDEHYFSNHYAWDNSFGKEKETKLDVRLTVPSVGFELGVRQSIMSDNVYYDSFSLPQQRGGTMSVMGGYIRKDFRWRGLHLNHRVLLQWSSDQEAVSVPLVSANATYFYEFSIVKNVLRLQLGVDGYYNTSYYGPGYNPALMRFYNQRDVKTGDYIWLDAFVSGKWKRVRFLVKLQHLNYELFGGRRYFQVAHYPLNRRMLKFGVSWNFYD